MVLIKLSSVCRKNWEFRDTHWQYEPVCQVACLCGLIACIGSNWHGIGVPEFPLTLTDHLALWHALYLDNLITLYTGSFMAAYGRLMKVLKSTKVVSEGALHIATSLQQLALPVEGRMNHKVLSRKNILML